MKFSDKRDVLRRQAVQMAYTEITPVQAAQNKTWIPVLPLVLIAMYSRTWISELQTDHQLVGVVNLAVDVAVLRYLHREEAGASWAGDGFDSSVEVVEGVAGSY